jgi:ADP-ribose pyrophosphatase YjhB (NUDIX family)
MQPKWLEWAKALQSLAQTGMYYSGNPFDIERYRQISAIVAEIVATYTDVTPEYVREIFTQEQGPSTPKVDVRGVAFQGDKILLVRERFDDGRWTLPGGWADVNESPAEATVREMREETGYETRAVKLLALYDKTKPHHDHPPALFHTYKVFFLCEIVGGEPAESYETAGVGFFGENELPDDLSTVRVTKVLLRRFFEHHRNLDLPTDFD